MLGNGVCQECSICGIRPEWNGKYLQLQVDHIDGDRFNNRLENLRFVCPNCHSQTETFAGRNKRKIQHTFATILGNMSREEQIRLFTTKSTSEICKLYNVREQTMHRWKKECGLIGYNLPQVRLRKVERPSKNDLQQDVSTMAMTAVGKKYGVTDNTIRKWCKAYGIPRESFKYLHNRDTWGKAQ